MYPLIIRAIEQFFLSGADDVRSNGFLLAEAVMGLTTEQMALVTTVVTAMVGGATFFAKWAFAQVDAIRAMAKERIEAAEKREAEEKLGRREDRDIHNKRLDTALGGMEMLTRTVQDQTAMSKLASEEIRRLSDGITQIRAQLRIERDVG